MSLDEILKKYAQHLPNCDINQPMWHKGPCDCGLAGLVKALSPDDRAKLGGRAAICTTCEDTGQASSGNWCGCELGVNRRKCEEASSRYGGRVFVLGKCCGCGAEGIPTTPLGDDEAYVCEACYDCEMRDEERAERVATGGHIAPCADFDGDGYCDGCNRKAPDRKKERSKCCAANCGEDCALKEGVELPFCAEHSKDEALWRAWEET